MFPTISHWFALIRCYWLHSFLLAVATLIILISVSVILDTISYYNIIFSIFLLCRRLFATGFKLCCRFPMNSGFHSLLCSTMFLVDRNRVIFSITSCSCRFVLYQGTHLLDVNRRLWLLLEQKVFFHESISFEGEHLCIMVSSTKVPGVPSSKTEHLSSC